MGMWGSEGIKGGLEGGGAGDSGSWWWWWAITGMVLDPSTSLIQDKDAREA